MALKSSIMFSVDRAEQKHFLPLVGPALQRLDNIGQCNSETWKLTIPLLHLAYTHFGTCVPRGMSGSSPAMVLTEVKVPGIQNGPEQVRKGWAGFEGNPICCTALGRFPRHTIHLETRIACTSDARSNLCKTTVHTDIQIHCEL